MRESEIPERVSEELATLLVDAEIARARARGYLDAVISLCGLPGDTAVRVRSSLASNNKKKNSGCVVQPGGGGVHGAASGAAPSKLEDGAPQKEDESDEDQHGYDQRKSASFGVDSVKPTRSTVLITRTTATRNTGTQSGSRQKPGARQPSTHNGSSKVTRLSSRVESTIRSGTTRRPATGERSIS